jgi:hypothetical protein
MSLALGERHGRGEIAFDLFPLDDAGSIIDEISLAVVVLPSKTGHLI